MSGEGASAPGVVVFDESAVSITQQGGVAMIDITLLSAKRDGRRGD
jgi:hypothetical protein